FNKSGLDNIIIIKTGACLEVIEELGKDSEQPFDLVFIDAAKKEYKQYVEKLIEKNLIKKGSILIADNVISHKNEMLDFIDFMKNSGKFNSETVDIRQGLEVSVFLN
ncbi:O-methyltransferase, partial [Nanoarchaeota archaeon]